MVGDERAVRKGGEVREPSVVDRKSNKRVRSPVRHRLYDGKVVSPVKYCGSAVGLSNYVAGIVNGVIVVDERGKPIPFHDFPWSPKQLRIFERK